MKKIQIHDLANAVVAPAILPQLFFWNLKEIIMRFKKIVVATSVILAASTQ
jgi:hypothetical protein